MERQEIKNAVECLLFVSYQPISAKKISEILELNTSLIIGILNELEEEYKARGFHLVEIAEGWQFMTDSLHASNIEKLYRPKNQQLSKAALETLAIIAYKQPVTRLEMESIRQIKVDGVVNTLLDKGLIREVGRRECAGKPILYGTTMEFLNSFGLKNLEDLPPIEGLIEENIGENLLFKNDEIN